MTIQTINIGDYANDGTGDDLRTAFQKVNDNFAALSGDVTIANAENIGTGVGLFAQRSDANLSFKTLQCDDQSITIDSTNTEVTLRANTTLLQDMTPTLGADLHLNGHNIIGSGNIEATVQGYDVEMISSILSIFMSSNANLLNINLGTFLHPAGKTITNYNGVVLDFGANFTNPNNTFDFGFLT